MPSIFTELAIFPLGYVIPAYYAQTAGLSLGAIGVALIATKIIDALTDPLMGFVADRVETRFGRRKPWLPFGAFLFCVGYYLIMTPTPESTLAYFICTYVVLQLGYTMYSVPRAAWAVEIRRDYDARTQMVIAMTAAAFVGTFLMALSPILLEPITGTTEFTGTVLFFFAVFVCIGLPLSTITALRYVPREKRLGTSRITLKAIPSLVIGNRPFQIFAVAYALWILANGFWQGLTFIYLDNYLGLGAEIAYLFMTTLAARLVCIPFWAWAIPRLEKHQIWAVAAFATAILVALITVIEPGEGAFLPMLILAAVIGFFDSAIMILPLSIIGDIADYDYFRTGHDRTASFKAFLALILKSAFAIGTGLGFVILGLVGFDVNATEQTATAITGLKFSAMWLPAAMMAGSAILIFRFQLGRAKHREIMAEVGGPKAATP